jgi:hypothetical protein
MSTQPKETKKFSPEEIQAALEICHSEYFMQVAALLSHNTTENKELTFIRVPVTTPQGGTYLVSILHVDGPLLSLVELEASAIAQKKTP